MAPLHSVHGSPAMKTPTKNPHAPRPQIPENFRSSENSDPNMPGFSHPLRPIVSPVTKSSKVKRSAPKIACSVVSPPPPVRERKFIVAKKRTKGAGKDTDPTKCRRAAYEVLRASQENFFRTDPAAAAPGSTETSPDEVAKTEGGKEEGQTIGVIIGEEGDPHPDQLMSADHSGQGNLHPDHLVPADDSRPLDLEGSSKLRKMRSLMMEEAMNSVPEPGSGRVQHLVKAFESLLSISKDEGADRAEESKKRVNTWALPGLQRPPKAVATEATASTEFAFPPKDFKGDFRVCSSFDSNDGRWSFGSDTLELGRRSRRNSSESLRSSWNNKLKVTRQHPFKLRTEQRGKLKEDYFINKVREMLIEEERKRIPIAQGLPWTTDEPECLVKPPVKETTEPVDLVLHSDVRAAERAAFDHYVVERMTLAEQIKSERERQEKLEEEEKVRKLRKELVPRAQPMPYFDRPFVPKKSTRQQTVPKEPRFHVRPHKACDTSLC